MKKICISAVLLIFILSIPHCGTPKPENIILFIGDGMGVACITAGDIACDDLNMEKMPVGGLLKTYPAGQGIVTDSAASGTALATGIKTENGMISMSPDGRILKTSMETAMKKGMKTGVVVTCSVTHATPAVFLSHAESRNMYLDIALQEASSGVDILFGGGRAYFLPTEDGGKREDGKNLLDQMKVSGYEIISLPEKIRTEKISTGKKAGFFSDGHMPRVADRNPALAEMTRTALELLKNKKGFFLMVEGSQIDWANHANDADWMIKETLDFDAAVGAALEFAKKNPATLIIVTSDHETGGLSVIGRNSSGKIETSYATDDHTASMVPLFASGPGSAAFGGIHDNTFIGKEIKRIIENR